MLFFNHSISFYYREGDSEESLGSPSDLSLSLVCWSISGKYLAGATEKMVNIWQVNGMLLTICKHFMIQCISQEAAKLLSICLPKYLTVYAL